MPRYPQNSFDPNFKYVPTKEDKGADKRLMPLKLSCGEALVEIGRTFFKQHGKQLWRVDPVEETYQAYTQQAMSSVDLKLPLKDIKEVRLRDIGLKIILSTDPDEKVAYTFAAYQQYYELFQEDEGKWWNWQGIFNG